MTGAAWWGMQLWLWLQEHKLPGHKVHSQKVGAMSSASQSRACCRHIQDESSLVKPLWKHSHRHRVSWAILHPIKITISELKLCSWKSVKVKSNHHQEKAEGGRKIPITLF